jgi:hypothetical protein
MLSHVLGGNTPKIVKTKKLVVSIGYYSQIFLVAIFYTCKKFKFWINIFTHAVIYTDPVGHDKNTEIG